MFKKRIKMFSFSLVMALMLMIMPMVLPAFAKEKVASETITVKVGSEFQINLKSNPTTGYEWVLIPLLGQKVIKLLGTYYIPTVPYRVGEGGTQLFVFYAAQPGETKVCLKHMRKWETTPPTDEKSYIIKVIK